MTISDYNRKPVRGDCTGSLVIVWVHLKLHRVNFEIHIVVTAWA